MLRRESREEADHSRRGTRATGGTVVSAEWNPNTKILGQHPSRVRYEYVAGGITRRGEHEALIAPPARGTGIAIEYASFAPDWSRIEGSTYASLGYFALFPLLFPALGAAMLFFTVRPNRREMRAFIHGLPVLARVTFRGQDESTSFNGRHPFMIRWEFRGPTGEVFEGSLTSMKLLELEPFGLAEQIVVLYDPADPRCNTLYVV